MRDCLTWIYGPMSAIFISHSSKDNEAADEIRNWLAEHGHRSVFLDFDPAQGIPAGRDWEQELYRGIRACRAVIVLCSEHSMASRWCFMEITHARALGKHLFPVKIGDCDVDGVLSDRQVIDLTGNKEEALQRLWHGILASGLDPADAFDWDGSRSPYPGLLAFQEEDAAIFFGRDDEVGEGLDVVNKVRRLGQAGLVMVLGASGSGKSSLVRAGLVPRLRRDTERWLVVDPFRPRDDPARALATVLSRAFERVGRTMPWERIYEQIQEAMAHMQAEVDEASAPGDEEAEQAEKARFLEKVEELKASLPKGTGPQATRYLRLLRAAVAEQEVAVGGDGFAGATRSGGESDILSALADDLRRRSGRDEARVLLLIDQFEELLGHPNDHQNSRFLQLLRHSLDRPGCPLLALGTMRSDFLGQFQKSPALLDVRYESLSVGPMSPEDVGQVIEKPALLATIDLEPGLVQAMLADAETEDALPLLAFTLRELNERYGDDGLLEVHEYRERLGGLQGAVAKAADEILEAAQVDAEEEAQLRAAFLAMVRITEEGNYARRVAHWDDLPKAAHPLLEQFVQGRLLVAGSDEQGRTLEVAHEALFRSWDRLVHWLEESAEALRLRHEIRLASRSWGAGDRAEADLWRGGRLARAQELIESGDLPLEELGLEFVKASYRAERALIEAEEARRQKELRRNRIVTAVVSVLCLIAVGVGIYAFIQQDVAVMAQEAAEDEKVKALAAQVVADTSAAQAKRSEAQAKHSARKAELSDSTAQEKAQEAIEQRQLAEAAAQDLQRQLEETEIMRLRSQIAALKNLIGKLNQEEAAENRMERIEEIRLEKQSLENRTGTLSDILQKKIAYQLHFRGDLNWISENELGKLDQSKQYGINLLGNEIVIDPVTFLSMTDSSTILQRYEFLLTPKQLAAVLACVGRRKDKVWVTHKSVLEEIQLSFYDVVPLVPEALLQRFWVDLVKEYSILAESETPPSVQTALLSLVLNTGPTYTRRKLKEPIEKGDWLGVADGIEEWEVSQSLKGTPFEKPLKERRHKEAEFIRKELGGS